MTLDSFSPEWLSPGQVAQLSNFSYTTVMRAIWHRELRAVQHKANGPWRVHVEWYDAWMHGRTGKPISRVERPA